MNLSISVRLRGRAITMLGFPLNCNRRTHRSRIECLILILLSVMEHFGIDDKHVRLKHFVWYLRSISSEGEMLLAWGTICAVGYRRGLLAPWAPKLLGDFERISRHHVWTISIALPALRRERPDPRNRRPPEFESSASRKIREAKQLTAAGMPRGYFACGDKPDSEFIESQEE